MAREKISRWVSSQGLSLSELVVFTTASDSQVFINKQDDKDIVKKLLLVAAAVLVPVEPEIMPGCCLQDCRAAGPQMIVKIQYIQVQLLSQ